MPHNLELSDFLTGLLHDFDEHLHKYGCYGGSGHSLPSLTNEVLPLFTDRWALSGPNQHTQSILPRIWPALQLASRWLMEDYPLIWFSQLTFGERSQRSSTPGTYLTHTEYGRSAAAVAIVKANLTELGEVVTLVHAPRSSNDHAYGRTYVSRSRLPFLREFSGQDWPQIQDKYKAPTYKHFRPCIVMNTCFQDFFRHGYATSSVTARYRVLFVFAVTLVHEVAHAYHFWLTGLGKEPLWDQWEKKAELGWSWERNVVGLVVEPLEDARTGNYRILFATQLEECRDLEHRDRVVARLIGPRTISPTKLNKDSKYRKWPLLQPDTFRGSELFLDKACDWYIAAIHAIPMAWIVSWFEEATWARRKRGWVTQNRYNPPQLPDSFVVLYERRQDHARLMRPLLPDIAADAILLRQIARKIAKKPATTGSAQGLHR